MSYQVHEVPENFILKWQDTTNVMADIFDVPAGLIMRVLPGQIEVLVSAHKEGNPYEAEEKANLNTGLYCETVMASRLMLEVSNALEDPHWKNNPDIALNMISYLGLPLLWPNDEVFGTICVLDNKTRRYHARYVNLLREIKRAIESDFKLIQQQDMLFINNQELTKAIIKQKQDAIKLQQSNEELNQAMINLSKAQAALLRSEKNAALGSLVAGVSHELNTPIGNSLTVVSTLQQHSEEFFAKMESGVTRTHMRNVAKEMQTGLGILSRNMDRAAKLVSSFKLAAIDHSSMTHSSFHLHAAINTIWARIANHDARWDLHNDVPVDLVLDNYTDAFDFVLSELFDNAIRHAFANRTRGTVSAAVEVLGEQLIQLQIRDDGIGIPAENLGRVFDPFFTTKLGQGNSGLGLFNLYNQVSVALRGTIEVESSVNGGSCFTLHLPPNFLPSH